MGWRKLDWMSWSGMFCKSCTLYIYINIYLYLTREGQNWGYPWHVFFRRLVVPRLYRLALQLRQHGVTSLRFGAVNCATEHQLCTEQGWLGMGHETHGPWDTWPTCQIWWEKSRSWISYKPVDLASDQFLFWGRLHAVHLRNPMNVRPSPLGGQVFGARQQHSWGYWALGGCG